ncbi:CPBP family intramembrane glutamic endopeptidase [Sphingomicrobium sp. XHP0239]|uniref:CPBP family intramembrane glutamic endopeptidase n=1 Tax=Sphingomicrobium maritimum TaxID=3133972 RepID=UPI0031CC5D43
MQRASGPAPRWPLAAAILLVSGYVFGSIGAPDRSVAAYFRGLRPDRRALLMTLPVLLLMPAILLLGHLLERLMGGSPPIPYVFTASPLNWLPTIVFGLLSVAALTGGNEEHGWRGVMQPVLHKRVSPLVAAIMIAVVWDVWHFPLHLAGAYGDNMDLMAIFLQRLPGLVLQSIVLAAIYQWSKGSIYLCILYHASINTMVGFFAGNDTQLYPILVGVVVAAGLTVGLQLWKRDGFRPAAPRG